MASYIVLSSSVKVPMPSQFDPDMFTIAAFDNFDHEEATLSGIKGSHDTASVLVQEKPQRTFSKPKISETGIVHGSKVFQQQLKYPDLQPYIKPAKKPELHPNYCVKEDLFSVSTEEVSRTNHAWLVGKMDSSSVSEGFTEPENKNQRCHHGVLSALFGKEMFTERNQNCLTQYTGIILKHFSL